MSLNKTLVESTDQVLVPLNSNAFSLSIFKFFKAMITNLNCANKSPFSLKLPAHYFFNWY